MIQNSNEWYEARRRKFTSSEIWKLMGANKGINTETAQTYIMEVFLEHKEIQKELISTKEMEFGQTYEPIAFELFCQKVAPLQKAGFEQFTDFWGGSADGIGEGFVWEVKCPYNSAIHMKYLSSIQDAKTLYAEKKDYYWQIQSNMLINNLDYGIFCTFNPRLPLRLALHYAEIKANFEDFEKMETNVYVAQKQVETMLNKALNPIQRYAIPNN